MEKSLAYYVTLLHKDFTGFCNQELLKLGLTQGQLYFILYVGKHLECSPKELAQALSMDTGHVTRTLAKLEQSGFLSQTRNEKDHRAHILQLREKGKKAFRISYELFARWDEVLMRDIPDEERTQLLALLKQLAQTERGKHGERNDL